MLIFDTSEILFQDQAMLTRSLKQFSEKETKEVSVTRNHRRLKIESGSESDEGPRNKTKYFKNRDKEREAQRKKGFYQFRQTVQLDSISPNSGIRLA